MSGTNKQPIDQMADAVLQLRDEMVTSNYAAGELMDAGSVGPLFKAKSRETEFWALVLTMVGTLAGSVTGWFDGSIAVVAGTVQVLAYSLYRQVSKSRAAKVQIETIPVETVPVPEGFVEGDAAVEIDDVWTQVEANSRRLEGIESQLAELNQRLASVPHPERAGHPGEGDGAAGDAHHAANGEMVVLAPGQSLADYNKLNGQAKAPDGP